MLCSHQNRPARPFLHYKQIQTVFLPYAGHELLGLGRIVLQYMTDGDNPNMRDGTDQDSAGGDGNDPTEEVAGGCSSGSQRHTNDFRVKLSGDWFQASNDMKYRCR